MITTTQRHNGFLIKDVCSFAYYGELHLIEGPLEELLIVLDQKFLDRLELPFSLGDRINVDTLD